MKHSLSKKEARQVILKNQLLTKIDLDLASIIEHLGYVQIDTISVVERAHHHVLWTRDSQYRPLHLDELVRSRRVFEYWSHAASFLPMKDYRYTFPLKAEFRERCWYPRDTKLMNAVLKRIRSEGPMRSKDFQAPKKKNSGWWEWKPTKVALERLFLEGKLEVSRREKFQKVYDLPERVIPPSVDTSPPSNEEWIRFLIQRTLRSHGLANSHEIAYLKRKDVRKKIETALKEMELAGEVLSIKIENLDEPYYALPPSLDRVPRTSKKISILSPFDNLVIQRKKLLTFFDFDYQIECYVPEKKRKYGYFSLPIFMGALPIARMDCKANRKESVLKIQSIHFEKNSIPNESNTQPIKSKIQQFASFNGCHNVDYPKRSKLR